MGASSKRQKQRQDGKKALHTGDFLQRIWNSGTQEAEIEGRI
jgi:hypothetical protein